MQWNEMKQKENCLLISVNITSNCTLKLDGPNTLACIFNWLRLQFILIGFSHTLLLNVTEHRLRSPSDNVGKLVHHSVAKSFHWKSTRCLVQSQYTFHTAVYVDFEWNIIGRSGSEKIVKNQFHRMQFHRFSTKSSKNIYWKINFNWNFRQKLTLSLYFGHETWIAKWNTTLLLRDCQRKERLVWALTHRKHGK